MHTDGTTFDYFADGGYKLVRIPESVAKVERYYDIEIVGLTVPSGFVFVRTLSGFHARWISFVDHPKVHDMYRTPDGPPPEGLVLPSSLSLANGSEVLRRYADLVIEAHHLGFAQRRASKGKQKKLQRLAALQEELKIQQALARLGDTNAEGEAARIAREMGPALAALQKRA